MLYHASTTENLKELVPNISSHGKPFVYAVKYRFLALLFGAEKDDFDFLMDVEDGKAVIYECYQNAFREIYENKKCSVYQVEEITFFENQTNWEPEWVSEEAVPVKYEEKVFNLYEELNKEIEKGHIVIHSYKDSPEYQKIIKNHVVDRILRFGILDHEVPEKIKNKFPEWLLLASRFREIKQ